MPKPNQPDKSHHKGSFVDGIAGEILARYGVRAKGGHPEEIPEEIRPRPRRRRYQKFLCGPIPFRWVQEACLLGHGQEAVVGIYLWWKVLMENTWAVNVRLGHFAEVGVSHQAARRALRNLAQAGLLKVTESQGRGLVVTVIDAPEDD
jgi:hypothetical protein